MGAEGATIDSLLALAALLFIKHWLADGPLQTDAQAINKGVWLHPDGLAHAGSHALGTAICLALWSATTGASAPLLALAALLTAEFVIHYLIDYSKCSVDAQLKWAESVVTDDGRRTILIKNKNFFFLFLADQTLHSLTYVGMLFALSRLMGA